MEYRVIKTATEVGNDDEFSEGEMEYIEREARWGAENAIYKAMARLRDIHHATKAIREAEQAGQGTEGGGPWIVSDPPTTDPQPGTGSPHVRWVPGAYSNRTAGEARPQAESPQAEGYTDSDRTGDGVHPYWDPSWGSPAG